MTSDRFGVANDAPAYRRCATPPEPEWSRWQVAENYTVGIEEEVMLLDPAEHKLSPAGDAVLAALSAALQSRLSPETHAAVLELKTGVHRRPADAVVELAALRERLGHELAGLDLVPACAGTHPLARAWHTQLSDAARYRAVGDSMRCLARREPTMALHVHVGVSEPEDAVAVLDALRTVVPILIALSANSPFLAGNDSGFCSARTAIFDGFPRTGPPRRFGSYRDYVASVEPLISSGALPDPTFLWWDVRLQPRLGTVEVRAMDAQTTAADAAPLVALIQSLARLRLEGGSKDAAIGAEILNENRFLAARDGIDACLIDPPTGRLVPIRRRVHELCEACQPHAAALGSLAELKRVQGWATGLGAHRQRAWARARGVDAVAPALAVRFSPVVSDRSHPVGHAPGSY